MSLKVLLMAMSMAAGSTFGIVAQSVAVVDVLKEVKAEYAPDTRVAVWSVMAKTVDGVEVLTGDVDNQSAKSDILARLDKLNIKFEDKIKILPEATVKGPWALVSISVACVRGAAASGAELTSQAIMGTPVRVLKSEDGMSMVQTPDEYIGYVTDNSLKFISEEEFYSWKKADRLVVTELETSMYEKPKVDNQTIVSDLLLGNILVKKGEKGKYYKVATPDGREGFVLKKHAAALEEWANQTYDFKTIEKNARKMMGRPYLWGGMSAKMADCSGFVRTSYFSNGIILQRDASQQALTGKKVDCAAWRTEAEPGDLIFIGSTSGKVTHVAMYVGGGKYIHSSGRVKVNSMDPKADDYLDYHFISMSRINNEVGTKGIVSVKNHPWYF